MTLCNDWLRGSCTLGESCSKEHPRKTPGLGSHLGAVSSWRPNKANWLPVSELSAKVIADELQQQRRPIWYTSCYAAADRDGNLRTGDVSPEELRLMACEARNKGEMNQYMAEEARLRSVATSELDALHTDPETALQRALESRVALEKVVSGISGWMYAPNALGAPRTFSPPIFRFADLPPELQVSVAEQMDYIQLKTLQSTSKSMRELVATKTPMLDVALFRERVVNLDRFKACLHGDPPMYDALLHPPVYDRWRVNPSYLKLHPVIALQIWHIAVDHRAPRSRIIGARNAYDEPRWFSLADIPLTAKENCTSPPITHLHFSLRTLKQGEPIPSDFFIGCEPKNQDILLSDSNRCIHGDDGAPITVELLLAGLRNALVQYFGRRRYRTFVFESWQQLAPHPVLEDVVNFCGLVFNGDGY